MEYMSAKMSSTADAIGNMLVNNSVEETVSAYLRKQGNKLARLYLPLLTSDTDGQSIAIYLASQSASNDLLFCIYPDNSWYVTRDLPIGDMR